MYGYNAKIKRGRRCDNMFSVIDIRLIQCLNQQPVF